MMKQRILMTLFLFILAGSVYSESTPGFRRYVLQGPESDLDWMLPLWKDINQDGLKDILMFSEKNSEVYIFIQTKSGFAATATQAIMFPENAAWFALGDIVEHPGDEILISTADGLAYYLQNNGVFETHSQKLLKAKQIIPQNHPATVHVVESDESPGFFRNAIPVITHDHTVIYKLTEDDQLEAVRTIEHEFDTVMNINSGNSWNAGGRESERLSITTTTHEKKEIIKEKERKKENPAVENLIEKIKKDSSWWGDHGIEEKDINADGREDLVLWHSDFEMDPKTTISVFIRQEDGNLPEKPDQILRCRGIPVNISRNPRSISLFNDINNNGLPEIVLLTLKSKPLSVSSAVEAAVTKGLECVLTIRAFEKSKGYSQKADFHVDITTMLPISNWLPEMVNIEGDFNGDGFRDPVVMRTPTQYDIYLSSDAPVYYDQKPTLQLEASDEGQFNITDLNKDSISDIYVVNHETGRLTVFLSESAKQKGLDSESK